MSRPKPGKLEMSRRYFRLVDLLGLHPERVAIQKAAKQFGVKPHQIKTYYLPKARELVQADIGKSRRELVQEHHHRLNTIYSRGKISEKLEALKQLASLHGLNAPTQVAVTVDVLYNPEEQLRAFANPAMLEKVLVMDAEFERLRVKDANGDGNPNKGDQS